MRARDIRAKTRAKTKVMTKAIRGVYAAAISPFNAAGALDTWKLGQYCQYLLAEGGCDGVAPIGTTGEGASISVAQKCEVPAALRAAGIPPERVILGVGSPAVDDVVTVARAALSEGYVNLLVLPPYYYKAVPEAGLFTYFAQIIHGVSDDRMRMYLYHFPQVSMTPLSPKLVMDLRTSFGEIVAGLKCSSGDFAHSKAFVDATGGVDAGFDVYPSSEDMLFQGLEAGCAGVISGSMNILGPLVQTALKAPIGAKRDEALQRVVEARKFTQGFSLMAAMKLHESVRSQDPNWLRMAPPLTQLDQQQKSAFLDGISAFTAV